MNIVLLLFEGFGNEVLRKISGSKIDETSAGRRILQNKKIHKFACHLTLLELLNNAGYDELDI
jgi:hypothetical protein